MGHSEVASLSLVDLNSFEKCFEVTCSESLMISSLNNLNKESWSVLEWLGEDLKNITLFIVVHQNVQFLDHI